MSAYSNAPARRGNRNGHAALLLIAAALCAFLPACGGGGGGGGGGSSAAAPYILASLVSFPTGAVPPGFVPTGFNTAAFVLVEDNSSHAPITNASVSINGVALTYSATNQDYEGNLVVAPGDGVALSVSVGGTTYTGSATQFTSYPVLSTPLAGATWSSFAANLVAWSNGAPTTNSFYTLAVLDSADPNGQVIWPSGTLPVLPTTTTSYTINPNNITAGSRLVIVGILTGTSIPDAAPNSVLGISGFTYVPVTVTSSMAATLFSIAVTPQNPTVVKAKTQQLTATGIYSDNSTQDLTTQVTWTSSDTSKATVSATGLASGIDIGSATITATSGSIFGSASVRVASAGFLPGVRYPDFSANIYLGNTAVGDLNGDGRNDVAVLESTFGATRILVYYQNAGGTLESPQLITTDLNVRGIAIGDVNNDGLADLVVSGNSNTGTPGFLGRIAVFRQDNVSHALGARQEYVLSTNNVGPLTIADLNGDSLPDVVSAGAGSGTNGVISMLFQGSGGVLGPEVTYTSVPIVVDGELHVADMNHDGSNDIVVQSGPLALAVIKQVSPGTFSTTPDFYTVQTGYWGSFSSFALGDLNGDGRIDLVVADPGNSGYQNIFLQNTSGILTGPTLMTISGNAQNEVHIADLDGDGLNDLIFLSGGNTVQILFQSADHSFQAPFTYHLPAGSGGTIVHQALSVGDVTGDGLPDIVSSWWDAGILVLPRMP